MKKRLLIAAMTTTLALGFLGACGVDNNRMTNDDGDNNFTPVRYDRNDVFDNDNIYRRDNNFDPVRYENDLDRGLFNNDNNGIFNNDRDDRRFNGYERNGNDTRTNVNR